MPDYLLYSLLILHGLAACGLFLYGMNCYVLLFLHRRMSTQGLQHEMVRPAVWPTSPAQYPRVTVQLPVYNERYVIQRLSGSHWIAVGGSRTTSVRGYFTVAVVAPKGTHFRISYPAGHATSPDLVVR